MKTLRFIIHLLVLLGTTVPALSQVGSVPASLSIEDMITLAMKHNQQLKVLQASAAAASEQIAVQRASKLPGISSGLNYGYVSNSNIWTPSFSEHRTAHIPPVFTQFSVTASLVIFRDGQLNQLVDQSVSAAAIEAGRLKKGEQDIRFLVIARYLDICLLHNRKEVFIHNVLLAKERLKNIQALQRQGMVTANDVLRTELLISQYELAIRKADFSLEIANETLNQLGGLPADYRLRPDTSLYHRAMENVLLDELLVSAGVNHPRIRISEASTRVATSSVRLAKAERSPELSAFVTSNLQRPFTNVMPAVDIYVGVWQAGVSLKYNISSLYQSRPKIRTTELRLRQAQEAELFERQQVDLELRNAYTTYLQAMEEQARFKKDLAYAEENFRIVEKKYLHQLALQADLIDAANIKVEAELQLCNARINIVYAYYQLLRAAGHS